MTFEENGADREPPKLGGFFSATKVPENYRSYWTYTTYF